MSGWSPSYGFTGNYQRVKMFRAARPGRRIAAELGER